MTASPPPEAQRREDALERLGLIAHRLNEKLCLTAIACLALTELVIVILRYVYSLGFLPLQDFATYCYSVLVVMGVPYALGRNAHVRVDVIRAKQSALAARATDALAVLAFLSPVYAMTAISVWPDISYAWQILEGSRETGGLGGRFLVKTFLPISCALMLLNGLIILRRRGQWLAWGDKHEH